MPRIPSTRPKQGLKALAVVGALLALSACNCAPKGDGASTPRDQGYSLLYDLVKSNRDVSKILALKRVDPAVRKVIGDIAEACGEARRQLDEWSRSDATLRLDRADLPQAEVRTRDAIAGTRTRELLFGSGKRFELNLLLTQVEALSYGTHLSRVVRGLETDAARRAALSRWAGQFDQLRAKVVDLIAARYDAP